MSRVCAACADEIAADERVSSSEGLLYHVGCLSLVLEPGVLVCDDDEHDRHWPTVPSGWKL